MVACAFPIVPSVSGKPRVCACAFGRVLQSGDGAANTKQVRALWLPPFAGSDRSLVTASSPQKEEKKRKEGETRLGPQPMGSPMTVEAKGFRVQGKNMRRHPLYGNIQ